MSRPITPHPVNPARPRPLPAPRPTPPSRPRPGRIFTFRLALAPVLLLAALPTREWRQAAGAA